MRVDRGLQRRLRDFPSCLGRASGGRVAHRDFVQAREIANLVFANRRSAEKSCSRIPRAWSSSDPVRKRV
jgi:hypothetical protein